MHATQMACDLSTLLRQSFFSYFLDLRKIVGRRVHCVLCIGRLCVQAEELPLASSKRDVVFRCCAALRDKVL